MNLSSISIAVLALTASASAQSVTFNGKVEDVSGTQNQFFLDCTGTSLSSANYNLNNFIGQQVHITGQWNGSAANPSVVVETLAVIPEVFELGGGAKLGGDVKLGFISAPGNLAFGRITLQPAFQPLGDAGTLFVDMSTAVAGASGTIPGSGNLEIEFAIPNNPALVGLELFGQGAIIDGAGLLTLTNPDCKTIDS